MKCLYGHAEMERKTVPYTEIRNGYVLVLQEVPAWVCPLCGETLFDLEMVDILQEVLQTMDVQVEKLKQVA